MSQDKQNQEYQEFGNRLKWLRAESKLSQKALAEKLGMPQQTYQGYESGIRKVTLQLLKQFANYFDVSIDFLAGRTSDRKFHTVSNFNDKFNQNEQNFISLYNKLDDGDKGEIRGEIKAMLKSEKYSIQE